MMNVNEFEFFVPTRVLFGAGKLSKLHEQNIPGTKALVVIASDPFTRTLGHLDRVVNELSLAGIDSVVFDKVEANPTKEIVEAGAAMARENGCDIIVALGGGSVMDSTKCIAMFTPQPSDDLWDYVGGLTGKNQPLVNPVLPWIAITTTSGTGSEVDTGAIISRLDTNEKILVGAPEHFSTISVVDPELMLTVPRRLTAYQGFDALFHSTEGYLGNGCALMIEPLQLAAIENVATYLPRCIEDGSDLEARTRLAFANTMSGYSMDFTGCIACHTLEHTMSAYAPKLPHGAGLIMIAEAFYEFYISTHIYDERFVRMAKAMGKADADKPEDFLECLLALEKACGVDDLKMSDWGFTEEMLPEMAKNAFDTGNGFTLDAAEITEDIILSIYRRAFK